MMIDTRPHGRPLSLSDWASDASRELVAIVSAIPAEDVETFCTMLAEARIIALHGLGREGLMMRAFTMRLFHLGFKATPVGDVTLPAVGAGDLLVASAGPGAFETIGALMRIARGAGAKIILLTAEPDAPLRAHADLTLVLPARTMARPVEESSEPAAPALPMGSAYEGALFLFSEHVIARLSSRLTIDEASMRARHTNLE
jgi:6-phospho-3-hexuloisomerase